MKKGQIADVKIDKAAFEGKGIGKLDDRVIFVKNTAPGDHIKARIIKKRKSYFLGELLEITEPGQERVSPVCRHATLCGGCTWQHVSYQEQLRFKREHVRDHIQRIGGFRQLEPLPTIGAEQQLHYRNKMEYSFGDRKWLTREEIDSGVPIKDKDFAAGMHIPGRFDRILNLEECHLQIPVSFKILDFVRNYAISNEIPAYNPVKKEGILRNLMIRNSHYTNDLMVNIVTFTDIRDELKKLTEALLAEFPEITTIVNNINDTWSPTSEGRIEHVIFGPGYIREQLGGYEYRIDANTFFQTNTLQAEALFNAAKNFASLKPDDLVFDLYCGVGSLSMFVCDDFRQVVGIELNPASIQNAKQNAERNKVENCRFEAGDMKDVFTDTFIRKYGKPDVIFTDPPRAGMHPDVVKTLNELSVDRLVYVSCNSSTMARDLALLNESYEIGRVQPVDMFPQTYHIETVAELTKRI